MTQVKEFQPEKLCHLQTYVGKNLQEKKTFYQATGLHPPKTGESNGNKTWSK